MMKTAVFMILFAFFICHSRCDDILVAPTYAANCTVNGFTLHHQCYTIQQLIHSDVLILSFVSQQLVFLPGRHVLPENETLQLRSYQVTLKPWDIEQEVIIECQQNAEITFLKSVRNVNITLLHFIFCAVEFHSNEVIKISNSIFEKCRQKYAVKIHYPSSEVNVSGSKFLQNNGALYVSASYSFTAHHIWLSFIVLNSTFKGNWDDSDDILWNRGTVYAKWTNLKVLNSRFINNTAFSGGAIFAEQSSVMLTNSIFRKNFALGNGSSIYLEGYPYLHIQNCQFYDNSAGGHGGVLAVVGSVALSIDNSTFQRNIAKGFGGVLFVITNFKATVTWSKFVSNSANSGGALYLQAGKSEVAAWEIEACEFELNKAQHHDGGAVYCSNGHIVYSQCDSFSNTAFEGNGGFAFLASCPLSFRVSSMNISNNSAVNGGAIYASLDSNLRFITSPVIMANNTATEHGGAVYMKSSKMYAADIGTISFYHNVAAGRGGAMFVQNGNCEETPQCFLQNFRKLKFANNSAREGSILYGGLLDRCLEGQNSAMIDNFKRISNYEATPLAITSDPVRACLCSTNQSIICETRQVILRRMRGEKFEVAIIVVDQDKNPKDSSIRARYLEQDAQLDKGEAVAKTLGLTCQNLSFHIFTSNTTATLTLQPENYCELSKESRISVRIFILPCARGLEASGDRCICESRLREVTSNDIVCGVGDDLVMTKLPIWLRYDEDHLLVHTNCPLDYCQPALDTISLKFPDEQCASKRSGVICGACQKNYSIALGGSKCLQCTSYSFAWLIPVFVVAGIALVAFLLVCNMTISHGTLNGLIFYANVVSIAGLTSLQNCSIYPILTVFIAWVNLDFGVETCFYSGMDMYQKTWLQYIFPLYIWLLVGAIIIASYYSSIAMRIFGRNNVAILTTLFLLSYTKFQKTIMTALKFTEVLRGSAHNLSDRLVPYKVWTYDGNVEYLKGKHALLLATAVILLVLLFIPYTLLLTFGQWLRLVPARRLGWFTRSASFTSIMDAYHAPYNKKHRYWTGLMLLMRCVLFLAFASSYRNSELLANMYITTLVLTGIFVLKMTYAFKVYKALWLDFLELCFLVNLLILSATLYYLRGYNSSNAPICKCTSASVAVSMVLFICILVYHAYLKAEKTRHISSIKHAFSSRFFPVKDSLTLTATANTILADSAIRGPTSSSFELREALLASNEAN